ncbi:7a4c5cdc-d9d3-4a50-9a5b-e81ba7874aaa [Sclerotinia trifoliorum]|uniref:7a4c5cdc-d9d3-4a50-9a5b-e81ba7874aaa n=1 Tax=Sclerotinia trifoliorum TaxID=28548 RepID=A0A8H2ZMD7_9HELO|nr:7a4c5cdc-d9d3-4a50-9a5b-e81ba7874aaa [Sclerotinia trifoliorum]
MCTRSRERPKNIRPASSQFVLVVIQWTASSGPLLNWVKSTNLLRHPVFEHFHLSLHLARAILIRYCTRNLPSLDWDDQFILSGLSSNLEINEIAENIDAEICLGFKSIPHTVWVWFVLGYEDVVILGLLKKISNTCKDLSRSFRELFDSRMEEKAMKVVKALRHRHPVAHWILSTSLNNHERPVNPWDSFNSVLDPIKKVFADQELDLSSLLMRLHILSFL